MESDEYLEDLHRVPDLDMESDADPTDDVDPLESEGSDMEGISSPGTNSPKPDGVMAVVNASGDPQHAVWAYKGRSKKKKKGHLRRRRQAIAVHLVQRTAIPFALLLQHTFAVRASPDRSILSTIILESFEIAAIVALANPAQYLNLNLCVLRWQQQTQWLTR